MFVKNQPGENLAGMNPMQELSRFPPFLMVWINEG